MKPETYFKSMNFFFHVITMMGAVMIIGGVVRGTLGMVLGVDIGYYGAVITAATLIDSWITYYGETL